MIHFKQGLKYACGKKNQFPRQYNHTKDPNKVTCRRCQISMEVRARKKVEKADKRSTKALEKAATDLWRRAVWYMWGGCCALCGKPCNDHNAHHFFTKGNHAAVRYEIDCGVLMDYGCHIGKVHRGGETEKVRDILIDKIGQEKFDTLKKLSWKTSEYSNDRLEAIKYVLEGYVSEMKEITKLSYNY